jgi:hypothetical protein
VLGLDGARPELADLGASIEEDYQARVSSAS